MWEERSTTLLLLLQPPDVDTVTSLLAQELLLNLVLCWVSWKPSPGVGGAGKCSGEH